MIADKWRVVNEKEKKKYEVLQAEAKAKYEKDIAAYEKKYGKVERVKKIKKQKKASKWEMICFWERFLSVGTYIILLYFLCFKCSCVSSMSYSSCKSRINIFFSHFFFLKRDYFLVSHSFFHVWTHYFWNSLLIHLSFEMILWLFVLEIR